MAQIACIQEKYAPVPHLTELSSQYVAGQGVVTDAAGHVPDEQANTGSLVST
jgi:hypothetical protein